jgi:RNA 2',3'-cyclic 3'-phosphodiesterase
LRLHPSEPTQRLFFALWPGEEGREALAHATAKAVRHSGGRAVPPANFHVTLAFLGSVLQRRVPEVKRLGTRAAADCPQQRPLELRFESLAHWPRQQILCAMAAEENPVASVLAAALKDAAAAAGFTPDLKPFRTHVTLARKVSHAPRECTLREILWRFESFALIDSRTDSEGPVYSVLESYPLVKAESA